MPLIGVLGSRSPNDDAHLWAAFPQGFAEMGYVESQNATIEYRWAAGQSDRLPALAVELVHRRVAAIATAESTAGALAVKAATTMIPIVFGTGTDPLAAGLVPRLSPGGNLTGTTTMSVGIAPKRLEWLHELVPAASIMALPVNPTNPALAEPQSRDLQEAPARSGCNCIFSTPATSANSIWFSHP
jgi:putative ABC transport system substrate-binding protein